MTNMTLLKVSHISKVGEGGFAMRDIGFTQSRLQKIAIAGETGSGKSTLLKIIAGLVQPDVGDVWLDKKRVGSRARGSRRAMDSQQPLRRDIGA